MPQCQLHEPQPNDKSFLLLLVHSLLEQVFHYCIPTVPYLSPILTTKYVRVNVLITLIVSNFRMNYQLVNPPSTVQAAPVTKEAFSLMRKAMTSPTSLGCAIRPNG